jgi:hypothetical protein
MFDPPLDLSTGKPMSGCFGFNSIGGKSPCESWGMKAETLIFFPVAIFTCLTCRHEVGMHTDSPSPASRKAEEAVKGSDVGMG